MHLFLYMILSSVELPMMPTTKIRQETMVFTYLKAYLISVGFKHMGGEAPRGRAGIWGGGGAEVLFLGGSETSATIWESRMKREEVASPASSRHSRTTARILPQMSSLALTFQKTHALTGRHASSHTRWCGSKGSWFWKGNYQKLKKENHHVE